MTGPAPAARRGEGCRFQSHKSAKAQFFIVWHLFRKRMFSELFQRHAAAFHHPILLIPRNSDA